MKKMKPLLVLLIVTLIVSIAAAGVLLVKSEEWKAGVKFSVDKATLAKVDTVKIEKELYKTTKGAKVVGVAEDVQLLNYSHKGGNGLLFNYAKME